MKALWQLLGEDAPAAIAKRRLGFAKAFENLLLVATAGAMLFAVASTLPQHLQTLSWTPHWEYTLDLVLRYLSILWFIAYFYVSAASNDLSPEPRSRKEIGFDLLQALAVIVAIVVLGFVPPNEGFGFDDGLRAFVVTNATVLLIAVWALVLFPTKSGSPIIRVRVAGAALAVHGLGVALMIERTVASLAFLLLLQVGLWIVWLAFLLVRLSRDSKSEAA